MTKSFRPHYGPGVNSAFTRKEYQGHLLYVKATVLRADNLATFMSRFSGNPRSFNLLQPIRTCPEL
jgi:hypothetical protein